jgi:hypothetical protein
MVVTKYILHSKFMLLVNNDIKILVHSMWSIRKSLQAMACHNEEVDRSALGVLIDEIVCDNFSSFVDGMDNLDIAVSGWDQFVDEHSVRNTFSRRPCILLFVER